jgi:hypothetical protein
VVVVGAGISCPPTKACFSACSTGPAKLCSAHLTTPTPLAIQIEVVPASARPSKRRSIRLTSLNVPAAVVSVPPTSATLTCARPQVCSSTVRTNPS